MPRSYRRRVNDRRREAEQRLAARQVFEEVRKGNGKVERYVRAVLRSKAGEILRTGDGRRYVVLDDGSFRRFVQSGEGGES